MIVKELSSLDVVLGRGTGPNEHEGNVDFRALVMQVLRESTEALGNRDQGNERWPTLEASASKSAMAAKVVALVHERGGQFVRKLDKQQVALYLQQQPQPQAPQALYEVVPYEVAMEKAKQSFRHQKRILVETQSRTAGAANAAAAADRHIHRLSQQPQPQQQQMRLQSKRQKEILDGSSRSGGSNSAYKDPLRTDTARTLHRRNGSSSPTAFHFRSALMAKAGVVGNRSNGKLTTINTTLPAPAAPVDSISSTESTLDAAVALLKASHCSKDSAPTMLSDLSNMPSSNRALQQLLLLEQLGQMRRQEEAADAILQEATRRRQLQKQQQIFVQARNNSINDNITNSYSTAALLDAAGSVQSLEEQGSLLRLLTNVNTCGLVANPLASYQDLLLRKLLQQQSLTAQTKAFSATNLSQGLR
mmetsp:Transcript_9243/g.16148  ORF Transcript_9243/g.16148 Transcript_9243/m.16148 type:complete len:419 (-) Transcript_9243:172-1428(-)|eukprot:CAMPEP_0178788544 /NCGR_PEP_ID=MMETSP0745-20121128/6441_1 /TAXON_ID=913974 /ORGANISM="Nitzschia punctata, Strain CCMP561" /LENGTH=418 /DNA_ID=CAMNT_0020446461 /DNA_START=188 /DNA_END=1444 /DNA_ORIENTATION=-